MTALLDTRRIGNSLPRIRALDRVEARGLTAAMFFDVRNMRNQG